jgi:hypothetical protein
MAVDYEVSRFTLRHLRCSEAQSNRVFVSVECLYGFKTALDGTKRIVKP